MMASTKRFIFGVAALAIALAATPVGATIKISITAEADATGKITGYVTINNNSGAQRCVNVSVQGIANCTAQLAGSGVQKVNGNDDWSFRFTGQLTNPALAGTVQGTVRYSAKSEPNGAPSVTADDCSVEPNPGQIQTVTQIPPDVPGVYMVSVKLDGSQEIPPNLSAATGIGSLLINTNTNQITYNIMHSVVGPTVSHIHGPAARDKNAGVLIGFPSAISPMSGTVNFLEANQAAIVAGKTYVNIHSGVFPGGEIRGQIPTAPADEGGKLPLSSEWSMLLLAIGLLGGGAVFALRRRQAA